LGGAVSLQNATPRYDRIHCVIGQGQERQNEATIRELRTKGIEQVVNCNGSVRRLTDALDTQVADLLLYDCDQPGGDFVELMQGIRKKKFGRNPFLVIVATVADSAVETVRKLVAGGVDDLIRKPISRERLFESVDRLMERRKPFTVSYNYVGPARRASHVSASPLIRVPNTMRSRAIEGVSDDEIRQMVDSASAALQNQHLLSHGNELVALGRELASSYAATATAPESLEAVHRSLHQLKFVGEDLRSRCKNPQLARIGDLGTMLVALVQRVSRKLPDGASVDVLLVVKLTEAINRALTAERGALALMREITDTIAEYDRNN
jgi:CheY-like chemotaxis protein